MFALNVSAFNPADMRATLNADPAARSDAAAVSKPQTVDRIGALGCEVQTRVLLSVQCPQHSDPPMHDGPPMAFRRHDQRFCRGFAIQASDHVSSPTRHDRGGGFSTAETGYWLLEIDAVGVSVDPE
jgi:hypothetical protein